MVNSDSVLDMIDQLMMSLPAAQQGASTPPVRPYKTKRMLSEKSTRAPMPEAKHGTSRDHHDAGDDVEVN